MRFFAGHRKRRTSSATGRNLRFSSDDYDKVHLPWLLEKEECTGNYRADCTWMWSQDGIFKQRNECYFRLRNEPESAKKTLLKHRLTISSYDMLSFYKHFLKIQF